MAVLLIRNDEGPVGEYITRRIKDIVAPSAHVRVVCAQHEPLSLTPDVQGVILCGSLSSVLDDEAWIHTEMDFVRELCDSAVPTLGICFGHQLIAQALGGKVERVVMHGGARSVSILEREPLFRGIQQATFLVSHEDQVTRLPSSATLVATSDYCQVQAFRIRDAPMWGIQFHPCYDDKAGRVEGLACVGTETRANPETARVFTNFLAVSDSLVCRRRRFSSKDATCGGRSP